MRDDFERRRRDGEDVEVVKKTVFLSSPSSFFDQFVAGAASGLAARLVTHPMDTIKSRMQVHAAATERTGHRGGALPRSGFGRNMITNTNTNINAFFGYYKGFGAVASNRDILFQVLIKGNELVLCASVEEQRVAASRL